MRAASPAELEISPVDGGLPGAEPGDTDYALGDGLYCRVRFVRPDDAAASIYAVMAAATLVTEDGQPVILNVNPVVGEHKASMDKPTSVDMVALRAQAATLRDQALRGAAHRMLQEYATKLLNLELDI
jgi:hypothetical protein